MLSSLKWRVTDRAPSSGRTQHPAAAEETSGPGADHRGLRRDHRPAVAAVPPAAGDGTPRQVWKHSASPPRLYVYLFY